MASPRPLKFRTFEEFKNQDLFEPGSSTRLQGMDCGRLYDFILSIYEKAEQCQRVGEHEDAFMLYKKVCHMCEMAHVKPDFATFQHTLIFVASMTRMTELHDSLKKRYEREEQGASISAEFENWRRSYPMYVTNVDPRQGLLPNKNNQTQRPKNEQISQLKKELSEKTKKIQKLEKEISDLKEAEICVICMDRKRNVAFIPCSHLVCCYECAQNLVVSEKPCGVCRSKITGSLKMFKC